MTLVWSLCLAAASLGGSQWELRPSERINEPARAELDVEILAALPLDSPQPLAARVIVTASDGSHPDGSGQGVYADGRFFVDGQFRVTLPAGATKLLIRAGPEFEPLEVALEARVGERHRGVARLARWFSAEEHGLVAGDNHVHAQHDARAEIRTSLEYTVLQARANGLQFITEAGSQLEYGDPRRLNTPRFLLMLGPEIRPGPFVGHRNTPGIAEPIPPERYAQLVDRPRAGAAITDEVRRRGGAMIYTHPLTPLQLTHWMGSPEALSDAVRHTCADACDVDGRASEQFYFTLLNLGNRLAVSSYTDAALGRRQTLAPGDRRVYCQVDALTPADIVKSLRQRRTIATNGGPIFPVWSLGGESLGGRVAIDGRATLPVEVTIHTLYPLKEAQLVHQGRVVHAFNVQGEQGAVRRSQVIPGGESSVGWYLLQVEDDRGNWALTSPIDVVGTRTSTASPSASLVVSIGNQTRFIELRRAFFAHAVATVSPGETLAAVEWLRNGSTRRRFEPAAGDQQVDGKIPVTGLNGEYAEGWIWDRDPLGAFHFQADLPIETSGWYSLRGITTRGDVWTSDAVHFDAAEPRSHSVSAVNVFGPAIEYRHWGYGEEMPLDEIQLPFTGDHWWFRDRPFWLLETNFANRLERLQGGSHTEAGAKFRRADRP